MMKTASYFSSCASFVLLTSVTTYAATPGAVETWDADLAGWEQSTTSSTPVHVAGGGNPDGHVQIRKVLGGFDEIGIVTDSNADFLGDFAADGINQVSVDINMFNSSVTDSWVRFRRNSGENGWLYSFGAIAPNANIWETYTTPVFDPTWNDLDAISNGWITDNDIDAGADPSPPFATVMSGVGRAEVRFDTATGVSTLIGVDNYRLVPEPSSMALLLFAGTLVSARRRSSRGK